MPRVSSLNQPIVPQELSDQLPINTYTGVVVHFSLSYVVGHFTSEFSIFYLLYKSILLSIYCFTFPDDLYFVGTNIKLCIYFFMYVRKVGGGG